MRMTLDIHLDKKAQELKQIPKGRHRVNDFIIYPYCDIMYRNPYDFVYLEEGEGHPFKNVFRHQKKINPLGYCPYLTQWKLNYLLADALSFCIGNKHSKEMYMQGLHFWKKKKKKNTPHPTRSQHCYPIAKAVHFEIETLIGLLGYTLIYRKKKVA